MKGLLKFITCGSVDDGKSTLIGHMLYDAKLLFADQERALELDSQVGSRDGEMDYSLLLDGLMSEREQGITIDVAYRYFTTEKRSFIVADTPGHEEYTRNMAVGASFAELAVLLVDATQGVLVQTRRHTRICAMMGIRHMVFAVNKMDLTGYDQHRFEQIAREIRRLTSEFDFSSVYILPVSATEGDFLTRHSENMPWFRGHTLLDYLEHIDVGEGERADHGFYMPVQRVSRPNLNFRGFQGQVESGSIREGEEICVLPSGERAGVKEIYVAGKKTEEAFKGQPVTICLDREIDISRGCVVCKELKPSVGNLFTADVLWMDDERLVEGKNYFLKLGTKVVPAVVMKIKYKIDVNTGDHLPADGIYKNEIARCDFSVGEKLVFDAFKRNRELGSFILMDRVTNMTSACGIIQHGLRRGENLVNYDMEITRQIRASQKGQVPLTLWFTGLSGSGKSTVVNEVEKRLVAEGRHTMSLDGDNVRQGLNCNLGFKDADRIENIRRIAEVAKLMNDAGLIVLTSFISPFESDRERARDIIGSDHFLEIYISTPLAVCEKRDVKGLYRKARRGEIPNFTGISSAYEPPRHADLVIDTSKCSVEEAGEMVIGLIGERLKAEM